MLGNVVPLWEVMLAAMKLGAVIIPASTLLQADDLADRVAAAQVRHVITEPAHAAKFAESPATGRGCGPPRRRQRRPAGSATRDSPTRPPEFTPDGVDPAERPAAAVLHLRAPRPSPSWSSTRTPATRSGTCRRCTGSGMRPGDVHLNISSPGWAKHAWSNVFAPWNAGATILILDQRGSPPRPCSTRSASCG